MFRHPHLAVVCIIFQLQRNAIDFNLAFQVYLAIAKAVFGPRMNLELQNDMKILLKDYEAILRETECELANGIVESVRRRDKAKEAKRVLFFLVNRDDKQNTQHAGKKKTQEI